ncbi:MAG: hypothetical protein M0Q87_07825 [Ottowia sp.]|nr:hypothetical protein [Ottowia sp.]
MKVWRQALSVQREPTTLNAQPPHHGGEAAVIAAAQRRGHTKRQRGHPSCVSATRNACCGNSSRCLIEIMGIV